MTETPPHVVLYKLGISAGDLIGALGRAQIPVMVVEPDPVDAMRVGEILRRQLPGTVFAVQRDLPKVCDFFLCRANAAGQAPADALVVLTDGPDGLAGAAATARTVAMDISDPHFVEIAMGEASATMRARALTLLQDIGADFVISDRGGAFAGTALQDIALALADRLLLAGTTPWELDEALEDAGFTQGLLKAQDQVGLDAAFARRRAAGTSLLVNDRMVREGRLGRSVGVGWYRYPGGGGAVIDPLMEDMAVEEAHFAGIKPTVLTDAAAADALILGLLNAAADLCADKRMTITEIDRISHYKLGLPGLARRLEKIGVKALQSRLTELQRIDTALWKPSSALDHLM